MNKRASHQPPPPRPTAKAVTKAPAARKSSSVDELSALRAELAQLQARVASLEAQLEALRRDPARRGPPPLPPEPVTGSIDITDVAELIETPRG